MREKRRATLLRAFKRGSLKGVPKNIRQSLKFLCQIRQLQPEGYHSLSARHGFCGRWIEKFFHNRADDVHILEFLLRYPRKDFDLFFSVNAFSKPVRKKAFALKSRLAHADLDDADPAKHKPECSVLWSSSPGRYQCLWLFDGFRSPEFVEQVSASLVREYGGDQGGWSCTKVLRLPHTFNHKPTYDRPKVRMIKADFASNRPWPRGLQAAQSRRSIVKVDPHRHDWQTVIEKYKNKIKNKTDQYLLLHPFAFPADRSRLIFKKVAMLHEAGATADEIGAVLLRSPYFRSKYDKAVKLEKKVEEEVNRILAKLG